MGRRPIDFVAPRPAGRYDRRSVAEDDESLLRAVGAILRPLVRRLFARGVRYGRGEARLRELFVEPGEEELRRAGQSPTASAVSLLAGINRKAVRRMRSSEPGRTVRASA